MKCLQGRLSIGCSAFAIFIKAAIPKLCAIHEFRLFCDYGCDLLRDKVTQAWFGATRIALYDALYEKPPPLP